MKMLRTLIPLVAAVAMTVSPGSLNRAAAYEIAASEYGIAPGTYPYAVAMAKGFFKEHGVDVTGVLSGHGSSPTIRDMVAGGLPFSDAGITGVLQARASGADVVPVGCAVNTFAEVVWVTKKGSPINSITDIKGRSIGYTSPKSATNMMAVMLVDRAGLKQDQVKLVSVGGFSELLTALDAGAVDVIPMVLPAFITKGDQYKVLLRGADAFGPISNTLLLSSKKAISEHPDVVRGIIAARREAVEFISQHPDEAGDIVAKTFSQDPGTVKKVIHDILAHGSADGIPYWGEGGCKMQTIDTMLNGARTVGMIKGDFDVKSIMDLNLLPKDLQ